MINRIVRGAALAIGMLLTLGMSNSAMAAPWDLFADAASNSNCDLINAGNMELVVLSDTGQLVRVTGADLIFLDTYVDLDGFVFYLDGPAGTIEFAEDGDGFRTLWWLTDFGDVADIDAFGEPFSSGLFPEDFIDVLCDACPFWDILDSDLDGVDDCFDECSDTPLGEFADADGCYCGDYDGDQDGVDDCFDLCPGTSLINAVDIDGCEIIVIIVDDPVDGITINVCGSVGALMMTFMMLGLGGMRLTSRSRIR